MWKAGTVLLVLGVLVARSVLALTRDPKTNEICPEVCEPEKCPNVGPIGLSQCPAKQYIVTYRCGCCKKCDVRPVTTTMSPHRRDEVCQKMVCPKKKVCVLNIQGLPVCKCPTEDLCKRFINRGIGKKVKMCGSDGRTYPSRCHLKVASCASDGKIRATKKGACPAPKPVLEMSTKPAPLSHSGKARKGKVHNGNNRGGNTRKGNTRKGHNRAGHSKNSGRNGKQHSHKHNRGNNKNKSLKHKQREDKRQQRRQNRKREKNYQRALRSAGAKRKSKRKANQQQISSE